MSRIKRGWGLTKKSWGVLTGNRQLLAFPLYGGIATTLMAIIVVGPGLYLIDDGKLAAGAPLVVIGLYLLALIGTYFSVGLAACADMTFHGRDARFSDGTAVARSRFGKIAGWALVSTVIATIIGFLEDKGGIAGAIFGRFLQLGWSLITFLAVPVIALEGTGPIDTLKRSAGIFRERWGEQVTGQFSIGAVIALASIIPAALLVGIGVLIGGAVAIGFFVGLAVVIVVVAGILSTALSQIFAVALYRYATGQGSTGAFTEATLSNAIVPRRGSPRGYTS